MSFKTIDHQVKDGVAWLVLRHLEKHNELNEELAAGFSEFCRLANEDENIRVLIVTGSGKTFWNAETQINYPIAAMLAATTKPLIIAINGDAIGQGLEIALAADIRIAADTAHFALPQATRGLLPSDGGSQRLPRIVGRAKALELLLTGETIDAAEALRIGLVSQVYNYDELFQKVNELAIEMSQRAPIPLRFVREAVYQGMDMTLEQGLRLEADLYALLQTTTDRTEGIQAFLEKRQPKFKGK